MNYFNRNFLFSKTQSQYLSYILVLIGKNFYPVDKFDNNIGTARTFYKL